MITPSDLQDLLGRWWYAYDQGHFDTLESLLTEDTRFVCRTDTGTTDYEEFVRADIRGKVPVMVWQTQHRTNSPFPLRHNGTNIHLDEATGDEGRFSSYIFVTHIVRGQPVNLSSGLVRGTVRDSGGVLQIAELEVVLDTMDSVPFTERHKPVTAAV